MYIYIYVYNNLCKLYYIRIGKLKIITNHVAQYNVLTIKRFKTNFKKSCARNAEAYVIALKYTYKVLNIQQIYKILKVVYISFLNKTFYAVRFFY